MEQWRVSNGIPGVAVAVQESGTDPRIATLGVRDPGGCDPVTPATLFRDAFAATRVTELAALRSVEDGLIDLDAPITEVADVAVAEGPHGSAADITLRGLLTGTAGLAPGWFIDGHLGEVCNGDGTLASFFAEPLAMPLWAPAGGQKMESMFAPAITGHALATAHGRPFRELAAELVLGPLGLTGEYDPEVARTQDHADNPAGDQETGCEVTEPVSGLYLDVGSLLRLYGGVARREGASEALLTDVYGEGLRQSPESPTGWQLEGIVQDDEPFLLVGSSWDGISTMAIAAPKQDFVALVVWLTGASGTASQAAALEGLRLFTGIELRARDSGADDLADYVGTYEERISGDTWAVAVEDGKLVARLGDDAVELAPTSLWAYLEDSPLADSVDRDLFQPRIFEPNPLLPLRFWRDDDGVVTHLSPLFNGDGFGPALFRVP